MRLRGLIVIIKCLFGDDDDKTGSILGPTLVKRDHQIEKSIPMLFVVLGVKKAPRLVVIGRGRPPSCFKQWHEFFIAHLFSAHRARRPAIQDERMNLMGRFTVLFDLSGKLIGHKYYP